MDRPATFAHAMLLPASELRDLSLDIRRACDRTTTPPFYAVLVDRPKLARVVSGQIVIRIRCQACGQPPVRVALMKATRHGVQSGDGRGARPWQLVLLVQPSDDEVIDQVL